MVFHVAGASTSFGVDEPPLNSWKMARCGLPYAGTSRPRWDMPMTISRTPSAPPALDDLLQRRDHQLGAVKSEALG